VLSGGLSEGELRAAGAIAVFRTPRDLLDNLDRILREVGRGPGG